MPAPGYRVLRLLSALVVALPIGTNLDGFTLRWLVRSGGWLDSRGALLPGRSALGLDVAAAQRTWAALGHGAWPSTQRLGWGGDHRAGGGTLAPHTPIRMRDTTRWRWP